MFNLNGICLNLVLNSEENRFDDKTIQDEEGGITMEIKKLFQEAVEEVIAWYKSQEEENITTERLGRKLHSAFLQKLSTSDYPDDVVEKQGIIGLPRLVAIKKLPEPIRDAWGGLVEYDEVLVAKGSIVGIVEDDLCIIKYPISIEEARKQKYNFLLLTQQEMEEAIELLQKHVTLDTEDIHGPAIGAMYPIGINDETGNAEWDAVAKEIKEREKALREAEEAERLEKEKAELREFAESLKAIAGAEIESYEITEEKLFCSSVVVLKIRIFGTDCRISCHDKKRFMRAVKDHIERKKQYTEWLKEIEDVKAGNKPIFEVEAVKIYLPKHGNTVEVPENLMGHFIGKEGRRIKGFSVIAGKKLNVRATEAVPVSRKAKINVVGYMEKPKFVWS